MKSRYLVGPILFVLDQLLRLVIVTMIPGTITSVGWWGVGYIQHQFPWTPYAIFCAVLLVVCVGFAVEVHRWPGWDFIALSMSILVAGGASNIIEGALRGFVTNYMVIVLPGGGWDAFNFGDVFTVAGLIMCLLAVPRMLKSLVRIEA